MSELIITAILIGVAAFTYTVILTSTGMLFERARDFIEDKLPLWLCKPLITCPYCVAGQWSLWSYFYFFDYCFFNHIFFISLAIFTTYVIIKRV
jgi:hypothetical protein